MKNVVFVVQVENDQEAKDTISNLKEMMGYCPFDCEEKHIVVPGIVTSVVTDFKNRHDF